MFPNPCTIQKSLLEVPVVGSLLTLGLLANSTQVQKDRSDNREPWGWWSCEQLGNSFLEYDFSKTAHFHSRVERKYRIEVIAEVKHNFC